MTADDKGAALFDVDELAAHTAHRMGEPGRVERMLMVALRAGEAAGILVQEDLGLIGSALAGARALDLAERGGAKGGPYATAALLTPYRETLAALRLPAAVEPTEDVRPPASGQGDVPSWLGEHFGTPE